MDVLNTRILGKFYNKNLYLQEFKKIVIASDAR